MRAATRNKPGRSRITPGDGDARHGTVNGYNNLVCRCADCRFAWANYVRDRQSRRPGLAANDPRHGTENGYGNWSCRCARCTRAWSTATTDRSRRRRTRQLLTPSSNPATGSQEVMPPADFPAAGGS